MSICTLGLGPGAALVTDIVVGSAPPDKAGSAASVSEASGEFGIATGVAVLGSLGTAVYRHQVTVPAGTPAEVEAAARDTLASAVAAAEQLPAGLAAGLLDPAREAFTSGLHLVAGFGAVAMVVFAVVAIGLLRQPRPAATAPALEPPAAPAAEPERPDRELVGAGAPGC